MAEMTELKLLALDDEDLQIISAHMQDSVFKAQDLEWHGKRGHFCLVVNRFVWEKAERASEGYERRKAALSFKRVQAVRTLDINRQDDQAVYSLLAIRFIRKDEGPDGTIELTLAGGSAISLDVECIEAQLADTGGVWGTENRPKHEV